VRSYNGLAEQYIEAPGKDVFIVMDSENKSIATHELPAGSIIGKAGGNWYKDKKKLTFQAYHINSDDPLKTFDFLVQNTDVEWGAYILNKNSKPGTSGKDFLLSTGGHKTTEGGSTEVLDMAIEIGFSQHWHSHPNKPWPSGLIPEHLVKRDEDGNAISAEHRFGSSDVGFAMSAGTKMWTRHKIKPEFKIYYKPNRTWFNYYGLSTWSDNATDDKDIPYTWSEIKSDYELTKPNK